ncbi:MAG: helix-turn-helix domain-containing protein [Nitrospirota bacterium]
MGTLTERVREIEREEIINALRENNWVMARAAKKLGITERMIGYKIRKYDIRKEEEKQQTVNSRQ